MGQPSMVTQVTFIALPFRRCHDGRLTPGEAQAHPCAGTATAAAQGMTADAAGAIAFSRALDLQTGCCGAAVLLHAAGDLPALQYLLDGGPIAEL